MSRDRQQYRVELQSESALPSEDSEASSPTERPDDSFRIALVGDFSGRANRGISQVGRQLGDRRPVRVDRDTVDDAIARLKPELHLPIGDRGEVSTVRFTELEDFHPDRLHDRLPSFRRLREVRELAAAPVPVRRTAGGTGGRGRNLLDEILGGLPTPPGGTGPPPEPPARPSPADPIAEFVDRAVAPHVIAETAPARPDEVADVDASIAADMRGLLHHPDFQALEANWRAVDFLVRRLETDSSLRVELVDVSRAEVEADLIAGDLRHTGTYRLVADAATVRTGPGPWALLVALFDFGPSRRDVDLLGRLAAVGGAAGAPWIAAAHPTVVGSPSFDAAPDPEDWHVGDAPGWDMLRRTSDARFVGLAAPRFLLRLPYGGADGEPCDLPGFVELSAPEAHEEYLWGSSAVLCALLCGEAFTAVGSARRPGLDVRGLPLHLVRGPGEVTAKSCAEASLTDHAVQRLLDRGVMAVRWRRDSDEVRLSRFQSIAEPLAALPVR